MSHMARTYLPTLVRILHAVCVYIARYREKIVGNLPPDSEPLVDAVIIACNALMDVINIPVEP